MIKTKFCEGHGDNRGLILWTSPKLMNFDYKYLTIGTIKPKCIRGGHYHKRTEEKLLCLSGTMDITIGDESTTLTEGEIVDIPIEKKHTVINIGKELATFVEFKSKEFDEDDKDTFEK